MLFAHHQCFYLCVSEKIKLSFYFQTEIMCCLPKFPLVSQAQCCAICSSNIEQTAMKTTMILHVYTISCSTQRIPTQEHSTCSSDKQAPLCLYQDSVAGILTQALTYTSSHLSEEIQSLILSRTYGVLQLLVQGIGIGSDGRSFSLRSSSSCRVLASQQDKIWCSRRFISIPGAVRGLEHAAMLMVLAVINPGSRFRENST